MRHRSLNWAGNYYQKKKEEFLECKTELSFKLSINSLVVEKANLIDHYRLANVVEALSLGGLLKLWVGNYGLFVFLPCSSCEK